MADTNVFADLIPAGKSAPANPFADLIPAPKPQSTPTPTPAEDLPEQPGWYGAEPFAIPAYEPPAPAPAPKAPLGGPAGAPQSVTDPFAGESLMDLAKRRGQQVMQGYGEGRASTLEGLGVLSTRALKTEGSKKAAGEMLPERQQTIDDIQEKLKDPSLNAETRRVLEENLAALQQGQTRLGQIAAGKVEDAKDSEWFKKSAETRKWYADTFGAPKDDPSFWAKVAQGGGSMADFLVSSMMGEGALGKAGALAAGAFKGSSQNAGQLYTEARKAGATEDQAVEAAGFGAVIGLSEIVPVGKAFGWLPSPIRNKVQGAVLKKVGEIALNSGEEAAQEWFQQVANNAVAIGVGYDKNRNLFEGAGENALIGAILGGGTTALVEASGGYGEKRTAIDTNPKVHTGETAPDQAAALGATSPAGAPVDVASASPATAPQSGAQVVAPDQAAALNPAKQAVRDIIARRQQPPVTPEGNPTAPAPAATEAAPVAPAPEAAPQMESQAPAPGPQAAGDTQPTVPEAPATIDNQNAALVDPKSKRKAVFIPNSAYEAGEVDEPTGKTVGRIVLPEGILFFNKAKGYTANDVRQLYKSGRLGTVLGLGEFTKADAAKSVAAGNPEVAVTERTPEGVEVKAASGTTETAPEQVAALEEQKDAGNTVQVESPAKVLSDRIAGRQVSEPAPVAELPKEQPAAPEAPQSPAAQALAGMEAAKPAAPKSEIPPVAELPPQQPAAPAPEAKPEAKPVVPSAAEKARSVRENAIRALEPQLTNLGLSVDDVLAMPEEKQRRTIEKAKLSAKLPAAKLPVAKPAPKAEEAKATAKAREETTDKPVVTPEGKRVFRLSSTSAETATEAFNTGVQKNIEALKKKSRGEKAEAREERVEAVKTGAYASVADEAEARAKAGGAKLSPEAVTGARKQAQIASELLAKHAPQDIAEITTPEAKKALLGRLETMLGEANERFNAERPDLSAMNKEDREKAERKYRIPEKVTYDTNTDEVVWLADAQTLAKRLRSGKATYKNIQDFLVDEQLVKKGDGEQLRRRRLEEGDAQRGGKTAGMDLSTIADTSEGSTEGASETKIDLDEARREEESNGRAKRGGMPRQEGTFGAASEGKSRADLLAEYAAKYNTGPKSDAPKSDAPKTEAPKAAKPGIVAVHRAQRKGSAGDGVGEAAYGIGRYWSSALNIAERYKDIVVPVFITGPKGTAEINRRDALNNRGKMTAALVKAGLAASDRESVVRVLAGEQNVALPDGASLQVGESEIVEQKLDTSKFVPQTGKARYNEFDLNNPEDIAKLKEQGIAGTSYEEDGVTNYVEFPGKATSEGNTRLASQRRPSDDFDWSLPEITLDELMDSTTDNPGLMELLTSPNMNPKVQAAANTLMNELNGRVLNDLRAKAFFDLKDALGVPLEVPLETALVMNPSDVSSVRVEVGAVTDKELVKAIAGAIEAEFGKKNADVYANITAELGRLIQNFVGEVPVLYVPDAAVDITMGVGKAGAYYSPLDDAIIMRKSLQEDPVFRARILIHEAAHAAFMYAIDADPDLRAAINNLRDVVRSHVEKNKLDVNMYWDTNEHEFISELFGNEDFARLLGNVKMKPSDLVALGIPKPIQPRIKSVLDALKAKLVDILGIQKMLAKLGLTTNRVSAFDASMDIAGVLLERAPSARKSEALPVGKIFPKRLASQVPVERELAKRGLSPAQVRDVAEELKALGVTLTTDEYDALAAQLVNPLAASAPKAKTNPDAPALPPKVTQAIEQAESPDGFKKQSRFRVARLKVQTLDYIVRRYASMFRDAKGNALEDYERAVFAGQPVAKEVQAKHDEDFAAFEEFRRRDPKEAAKLTELITELAPYDVNLGPGANNDHLGNGKADIQAKARLPQLQAQYATLSKDAKALLHRMADHYRETHNDQVRGVVYNILSLLDTKLSNSEVMRLMDAATEGRLTEDDKAAIGDDTIFKALVNAKEMRARKGMYFPSARFGNYVVTTRSTVTAPAIKTVTTKASKKTVPVKTETEGNTVRFIVDPSERGTRTALNAAVDQYVADHDLPLSSYRVKFKDRKTGEIVSEGEQRADRQYDYALEVKFQDQGVHFFEDQKEAARFAQEAAQAVEKGELTESSVVMNRHNTQDLGPVLKGSVAEALMRSLQARDGEDAGKKTRREEARRLLEEIVAEQLPGNRFEKRLLKRKNVAGVSSEVGRAAAHYGRAAGNYMAQIVTGPARHDAFDRMLKIERERGATTGALGDVMNELRTRHVDVGGNEKINQLAENLIIANGWDKLGSVANWIINGQQVINNTLPVLGGRHGNARASGALTAALYKMGAGGTIARGLANTGKAVTQVGKFKIDTSNVLESVRKNLGQPYAELLDTLVEQGDIDPDMGIESAAQLSSGAGGFSKTMAKVDRIVRQMPNAVEVVNRVSTAVAAYDLARKDGRGHKEAIDYAVDVTRQTQGRYDRANAPMLMRSGFLRFALVFKKYAQLQYQLLGDMLYRATKDASAKERRIARKQVANLLAVNFLYAGALGLPGVELIKIAGIVLGMALGQTWDDEVEKWREMVRGAVGKDWEQIIDKGLLSYALNIELTSRMGWQDMVTGFAPESMTGTGLTAFVGQTVLGAPGGMIQDWINGAVAFSQGEIAKGLQLTLPLKTAVDTVKAVQGYQRGSLRGTEAVAQAMGFRSLRVADKGDAKGVEIRTAARTTADRKKLMRDFINARTSEEKRATRLAIEEYNAGLPKGDRNHIGTKGLEALRNKAISDERSD